MADTPYPIPRELRQTAVLSADGTNKTYGPFAWKIFDAADVCAYVCPAGDDAFTRVDVTVTKVSNLPQDFFRVSFTSVLSAGTKYVIASERLHERSAGITRGTQLDQSALEKELSKQGIVLQETRRDIGRSLKVKYGDQPQDLPTPDGVSLLGWGPTGKLENRPTEGASLAAAQAAAAAALAAANAGFVFNTEADFAAAAIPAPLMFVRTSGYYGSGDGGGHLKRRISAAEAFGPDLLVNGDFSSPDGWVLTGVGATISAGRLNFAGGGSASVTKTIPGIRTNWLFELAHTLVSVTSGNEAPRLDAGTLNDVLGVNRSAPGAYTELITSNAFTTGFQFVSSAGFIGVIDNVTLRPLREGVTRKADGSYWEVCEDTFSFEMFGARGVPFDDYAAIASMLKFAGGRRIRLAKGRTYNISQPIVCDYDVRLDCNGAYPSEFFANGQTFKPLTIQGSFVKSTVLTANKQINVNQWLLDTTGIEPGMLMEVKSSASWYHDPRPLETDARKSELHRVAYIAGPAALYTEDPANDGYDISTETVTVSFFRPVKVHLENIAVRAVLDAPAETTQRFSGIHIKYADEPRLINVDVTNCANSGIFLEECYRPHVWGGRSIGVNNYFSGYGVQFWGCSFGRVQNRKFWNCRRGVDVSGGNIISMHTTIEGCEVMGGGVNSRGDRYGWNPDSSVGAYQAGFGTHGPADHTIYRGNRTANLHSHYECRGRNEMIENNYMVGRSRTGLVSAGYGENLTIRGNKAYAGWSGLKNGAVYDGGGNSATRRADYLVQFAPTYDGKLTGRVVIEDNELELQDIVVNFSTDSLLSSVCNNMIVRNNRISMFPQSSATECVLFNNAFATLATPSGWLLDGNKVTRESGAARIRTFNNIDLRSISSRQVFGEVFSVNMLDDTVVVIPVPEATTYARVSIDATSASGGGLVGVRQGTATLVTNNGAPASMVGFNGVLTGVNGTDGSINVSLQDGFLYVSNRLGSTQRILVSINYAY